MSDIVILTESRYENPNKRTEYINNLLQEDALVQRALEASGLTVERVDWARREFDWSKIKAAVFRSTWDYFDRFHEFVKWLDQVETATQLINPAPQVRWNLDKHYLLDLEKQGIRIVPTEIEEKGSRRSLGEWLESSGHDEVILKPAVSGAARHTYRVTREDAAKHEPILRELLREEAMMLQPFQVSVPTIGEISIMVMGGRFTHAVQKNAKPGDFRVQDDHGGTVKVYLPRQQEIDFAERVFAACDPVPAYGRVDLVVDNDSQLAVMELELVEPELWFRFHPAAATDFAEAVVAAMEK